jgi:GntR family transcriptional regulator, transcriptional repressor for pyruvate dehydrogenase complex
MRGEDRPNSEGAQRAWQVVLAHIESDLAAGAVGPGDHLPAERALAAGLGVGRSSVREAIRALEVLGLVRTQTGSGPAAGATIVARPSGGMSALMRLQVAAKGFAVQDVARTRIALEAAVVADLATVLPSADLSAAVRCLDAMERGRLEPAEFLALDAQFHVALAEASGNEVTAAMMVGLRDAIQRYVLAGVRALSSWADTQARLAREHRGIVAAVQARDPALAAKRIQDHINGYYSETRVGGACLPRDGRLPT